MKKTYWILALSLLCAARASADGGASAWFKNLYKALTTDTAQHYASRGMKLTSVAAVRGAPLGQQDPAEPYWKGGISEQSAKALAVQRKDFAAAVQLVMDGKPDEGRAALEKFEADYPKSAMVSDVKEALDKLPAPAAKADLKAPPAADAQAKPADAAGPAPLPIPAPGEKN